MIPALAAAAMPASSGDITLFSAEGLLALATLTLLEVILGIDNIVFLAILTNKLPEERQAVARRLGLGLALLARLGLLLCVGWLMTLTTPLFTVFSEPFSGKDLILIVGGLFLLAKATSEIYHQVEGDEEREVAARAASSFGVVIAQIVAMDVIFSLDSVLTAIGMVTSPGGGAGTGAIIIMVVAITIAIAVMLVFATPISVFIEKHPSLKVLALAFLVLIGVLLTADGLGQHLPRGYVYAALSFSLFVEFLQIRAHARKGKQPAAA